MHCGARPDAVRLVCPTGVSALVPSAPTHHMTGPTGDKSRGFFEFLAVDEPHAFEVLDGFLDADGKPAQGMPTMRIQFTFEPQDGGTRMMTVTTFPSREALEQLLGMGMEEGMLAAMGQIEGVLLAS